MKKSSAGTSLATGLFLGLSTLFAQGAKACSPSEINMRQPAFINVFDANTGVLLYGDHENMSFYQASLTKRMVLLMTLDAIKEGRLTKDRLITVPNDYFRNANGEAQTTDAVPFGVISASIEDLIKAMNTRSSNRAPKALAIELGGGSEENFVRMMNAKAAEMGMTRTHFVNASGYPTKESIRSHRTTASDHAKIIQALYDQYPDAMKELLISNADLVGYRIDGRQEKFSIDTTDDFMPGRKFHHPDVLGGKTGYACTTGTAIDVEATINGRTVIIVTAGHNDRKERDEPVYALITNPPESLRENIGYVAYFEEQAAVAEKMKADAMEKEKQFSIRLTIRLAFNQRPSSYSVASMPEKPDPQPPFPDSPFPDRYPLVMLPVRIEDENNLQVFSI